MDFIIRKGDDTRKVGKGQNETPDGSLVNNHPKTRAFEVLKEFGIGPFKGRIPPKRLGSRI